MMPFFLISPSYSVPGISGLSLLCSHAGIPISGLGPSLPGWGEFGTDQWWIP